MRNNYIKSRPAVLEDKQLDTAKNSYKPIPKVMSEHCLSVVCFKMNE